MQFQVRKVQPTLQTQRKSLESHNHLIKIQNAVNKNVSSTQCLIQHWATNPPRHAVLLFLSLPHLILLAAYVLLQPNPKFGFNSDCGLLSCERGHRTTLPVLPWRQHVGTPWIPTGHTMSHPGRPQYQYSLLQKPKILHDPSSLSPEKQWHCFW
jgi:hypothetical protein